MVKPADLRYARYVNEAGELIALEEYEPNREPINLGRLRSGAWCRSLGISVHSLLRRRRCGDLRSNSGRSQGESRPPAVKPTNETSGA
jgi:hypothetical protein